MKKRVLSLILVLAMCLSLMPTAVWAEEPEAPDGEVVETSISDDTEKQDAAVEADEPEDAAPAVPEVQTGSVLYVYAEDRISRERLTKTAECTYLVSSDTDLVLDGGWYAVTGSVTINGNVTFTTPEVNLILCITSSQI